HHGLPANLVKGDILRAVTGGAGDGDGAIYPLGVDGGPLQGLHPAHRAADNAEPAIDAEIILQHCLCADHDGDVDDGEGEAVGLAGLGVDLRGPGCPHAAAEAVAADDIISVRVEDLAGADHHAPPAVLAGDRLAARR